MVVVCVELKQEIVAQLMAPYNGSNQWKSFSRFH